MDRRILFILLILVSFLPGCGTHRSVPVQEMQGGAPAFYQVKPGDTLYSIAWHYGKDYRELARLNHISPPYKIKYGQKLSLGKAPAAKVVAPVSTPVRVSGNQSGGLILDRELQASSIKNWLWPVQGRVLSGFAARGGMNKGIDIAAKPGASVRATAAGKVVYSGSGLRGYGELVIIKHNNEFLSAYAHNKKLFVHEGEDVTAGQIIAQVGSSDARRVLLHFEIRRAGRPVDPLKYLPPLN